MPTSRCDRLPILPRSHGARSPKGRAESQPAERRVSGRGAWDLFVFLEKSLPDLKVAVHHGTQKATSHVVASSGSKDAPVTCLDSLDQSKFERPALLIRGQTLDQYWLEFSTSPHEGGGRQRVRSALLGLSGRLPRAVVLRCPSHLPERLSNGPGHLSCRPPEDVKTSKCRS